MKKCLVVVPFVFAMLLLSACGGGSGDSTSATSAAEPPAESQGSGGKETVAGPSEKPPTSIPAGLEPLEKPPPSGINVVNLQCDFPTCTGYSKVFQEIGKNLGWKVKTIVFKTGQPQDAMTQAVNSPGVEFVNISGIPTSIIKPQLKIAAQKDIVVIKGEDPGPPEPPTVPVAISGSSGNSERPAEELTRWMINDSGGKAQIGVVGLPEIPGTATTPPAVEEVVAAECPECSATEIPVTGEELAAGTVPAKVVAYLQAHPETNYIMGVFGNLMLGLPQAIKTAGLADKVKLVTMNGIEAAEAQALANREIEAFNVAAQGEFSAAAADAIIRVSEGLELPQKTYEDIPQHWLCTPATAAECEEWETFPPEFLEKYEELWGVR